MNITGPAAVVKILGQGKAVCALPANRLAVSCGSYFTSLDLKVPSNPFSRKGRLFIHVILMSKIIIEKIAHFDFNVLGFCHKHEVDQYHSDTAKR